MPVLMASLNYTECDCNDIKYLFNGELVLLVTATELETNATHKKLKAINGYNEIIKVFEGDLTYYFGALGSYNVVHVQSSMGSLSRDSSIMTVSTALKKTKAKIVIMVGIAFGIDEQSQNIGDVLVSESIIPYNSKRVGKKSTVPRGIEAPSSKVLLNRFKNLETTWEYTLPNGQKAKLIPTRLLSGEELVDNLKHRNRLIKDNPSSKGGEMEGAGIYAACDRKADWIVVKGICDFADGEKGKDKIERQTIAIESALSLCIEIFNSPYAFKELKVFPRGTDTTELFNTDLNLNAVLFDIYDETKEKFYIERDEDKAFVKTITQYGMWVHGPAGCGKSNLILRNLIRSKKNFIQISLASCIGLDIESFFKEILYEIAAKMDGVNYQIQPKNFTECSKALLDLLKKYFNNKEVVIFIEEIPISSETNYKEFADKIFSLLISKNLVAGLEKVRFVLSSINNPIGFIQIFQQKIHQQLNFVSLKYWAEKDIQLLIEIIEQEFQFSLPLTIKEELITVCDGSPRFVKKFFRSVYTLNKTDEATLRFVLQETKRELSQFKNA